VCQGKIADTRLQSGQGMHAVSVAPIRGFHGGPRSDFRKGFTDGMPASNADIGMTIAHLLG